MTLPTPSTPGYGEFRGFTACDCLIAWLPVYEALAWLRGLIDDQIDIWQLTGLAAASALTHSQGGVGDTFQYNNAHVALAREMGAPAAWRRTTAQGFSRTHMHFVLTGCPHNSPARYQVDAQRRGYNGLGVGPAGSPYAGMAGYGGADYHPDPKTYRTWSQGITWARARIQEAMMDITLPPAVIAKIADAVWAEPIQHPTRLDYTPPARSWMGGTGERTSEIKYTTAGTAVDVDALVRSVTNLTGLVTTLTATVAETNAKVDDLTAKVDALPKA